ncbi:hypothetical protein [Spirosoma areae]
MTEYALNRLTSRQLAQLAFNAATLIAVATELSVKLELYYIEGYFIEVSYSLKKLSDKPAQWRLYSANHYPDVPASTKYLTIFLQPISLEPVKQLI